MAEDQEGLQPTEYIVKNPEALKRGVKERVRGVLDFVVDRNPVAKDAARGLERINAALPEGRLKQVHALAVDVLKGPMAVASGGLELLKIMPAVRLLIFFPEQAARLGVNLGGFAVEKIVESKPAQFAVGTVEGVMDKILGKRAPVVEGPKPTLENAHQMLVGMARPEMGKQERRKMG